MIGWKAPLIFVFASDIFEQIRRQYDMVTHNADDDVEDAD